jgi:small redox-active disulfide protein 2
MTLDIRVAGPGCKNCQELAARVHKALEELEVEATVMKVTEFKDIAALGILSTPGLVINGRTVLQGKLPTVAVVKTLIAEAVRS